MCIIVAKPQGVEFPRWRTLKNCWQANPDGAGFMVADGGRVKISKGYMSWRKFEKSLKKAKRSAGNDAAFVIHFRIATHGDVSPECCHPFPLARSVKKLRAVSTSCAVGIAHNGVIPNRATDARTSDTMDYIRSIIHPLSRMTDSIMHDHNARKIIEETLHSKLCMMDASGDVELFGQFETVDGVHYSNDSYMDYPPHFGYFGSWYDDDDDLPYGFDDAPSRTCDFCPLCSDCERGGWYCTSEAEAREMCAELSGIV